MDGFNDLQENLYKHLTKYLKDKYFNVEKDNREIKNNIESAIALLELGILDGAEHYLQKTYKLLKQTKPSNSNYHYFLQYLNTVPEYLHKSETTFNSKLSQDLDNLETLNYLHNIAINAANRLITSGDLSKINFSTNSLLELFYNLNEIDFSFMNSLTPSIKDVDQIRIKDSFEYLMALESVYASYKLKDITDFNLQVGNLFSRFDKWKRNNYQLYAFVLVHTWSLQLEMQVECKYPFDQKKFFDVLEKDFMVYTDSEIEILPFRIELNKARLHLLSGNYLKAYNLFKGFNNIESLTNQVKLNLLLSGLLSYLFGSINAFESKIVERQLIEINKLRAQKTMYTKALLKLTEDHGTPRKFIYNLNEFRLKNKPEIMEDKIFDICFENVLRENALLNEK
jgi:hypothetical protein